MPDLIFITAAVRRTLQRPAVRRTIVSLVALGTAAVVAAALRATDEARSRWGETRPVVVALRPLEPGDLLEASAVEVRSLPAATVTADALTQAPVHATVREPIAAGEPVVARRLAPTGVTGTAALVPDDHRAIGLPAGQLATPPLAPGDVVDVVLLSSLDLDAGAGHDHGPDPEQGDGRDHGHGGENGPWSGAAGTPGLDVVTGARVLDVTDEVVTLSVTAPEAPLLAHAAATGIVALTLTNR